MSEGARPGSVGSARQSIVLIFLLLFIGGAAFDQPVEYDNTLSRFLLVRALVDDRSPRIDRYANLTIDKSRFDGHDYSNKAPGASVLAAPVYAVLRLVLPLHESPPVHPVESYAIRLFASTLPFALLGVGMFRLAQRMGADPRAAYRMVVAFAFGTIAWIHAGMFSGHGLAAAFAFFAFAAIERAVRAAAGESPPEPARWLFLAGLLAGAAAATDFTAMLIAGVLTLYVLSAAAPLRAKAFFLAGGGVVAVLLGLYNAACFGSPFSMSYGHQSFGVFKSGARVGLFGIGGLNMKWLAGTLVSPARGLVFISPVLLIAWPGFVALFRSPRSRRVGVLCAAVSVAYVLFNASYYCWHGGWTYGPRLIVPMLPFVAFPLAFSRVSPRAFLSVFLLSVLQVGAAVVVLPHCSEKVWNPLWEIVFPCARDGYTASCLGLPLGRPSLIASAVVLAGLAALGLAGYRSLPARAPESRTAPRTARLGAAVLPVVCGVILAALLVVRTPRSGRVLYYRWRLLRDVGAVTGDGQLIRTALRVGVAAGAVKAPQADRRAEAGGDDQ